MKNILSTRNFALIIIVVAFLTIISAGLSHCETKLSIIPVPVTGLGPHYMDYPMNCLDQNGWQYCWHSDRNYEQAVTWAGTQIDYPNNGFMAEEYVIPENNELCKIVLSLSRKGADNDGNGKYIDVCVWESTENGSPGKLIYLSGDNLLPDLNRFPEWTDVKFEVSNISITGQVFIGFRPHFDNKPDMYFVMGDRNNNANDWTLNPQTNNWEPVSVHFSRINSLGIGIGHCEIVTPTVIRDTTFSQIKRFF